MEKLILNMENKKKYVTVVINLNKKEKDNELVLSI